MPVIEQNFIFPSDLDPEVFGEKTKGGKKYITVTVGAEGAGTDTNEVQFGTETKTVKAQIEYETCTLVFTELLNHNRNGKRMFVCTDVIQDGDSLIEETTEAGSDSSHSEGVVPPLPGGDDFTGVASRTYIGAGGDDKGVIITALNREIRNIPFDIKIVTDRLDIENYPPYTVIRRVDDGFIITVRQVPQTTNQELSFIINDFEPSMNMRLEFPDGKTAVYQPTPSRVPIEEE